MTNSIESQGASSMPIDGPTSVKDYLRKQGRLKLWAGGPGHQAIEDNHDLQQRNLAAEDAAVRRQLWNEDQSSPTEDDEMRQTILGDQTTTHIHQAATSGGLGKLASAALVAGAIATGVGGTLAVPFILNWLKPNVVAPVTPAPPVYDPKEPILLPGRPQ